MRSIPGFQVELPIRLSFVMGHCATRPSALRGAEGPLILYEVAGDER
jgi:hypothetical protein